MEETASSLYRLSKKLEAVKLAYDQGSGRDHAYIFYFDHKPDADAFREFLYSAYLDMPKTATHGSVMSYTESARNGRDLNVIEVKRKYWPLYNNENKEEAFFADMSLWAANPKNPWLSTPDISETREKLNGHPQPGMER